MTDQRSPQPLLTVEFLAISAILFLYYCNIAVFFSFYAFLGTLPVDPKWFGFIIGVFSMTGLVIRPIISPFMHPGNARKWIGVSTVAVIVSLALYDFAGGLWSMTVIRAVHGLAHVVLGTAVIARLVACIPKDRSGEAFGLITVLSLLPCAVIPPVLAPLTDMLGGFDKVLLLSAAAMVPALFCLTFIKTSVVGSETHHGEPIRWADLVANLRHPSVFRLLVLFLLVWTTFTPVFFFLKEYGEQIRVGNPGWFFTLSVCTEIGIRLVAGKLFDRISKRALLAGSIVWLVAGYLILMSVTGETAFYAMGLFMGIGWGVALPVMNGLLFDLSEPRFRGLNTNLGLEMSQAGYVVGPMLGGAVILHSGYPMMFGVLAAVLALGLPMLPAVRKLR